jgi:drug/metabolite transporter (DMT)-like permease
MLILAAAAILFSSAGLLIKIITISPLSLVGGRSLIASLVIAIYLRRPHFSWAFSQVGGAAAMAATQIFFVIATRETTAANAIFIQYTAPVFVAIFGIWFLGERAQRLDWLTMAAIGLGFYFFFSDDLTLEGRWGNFSALLSGITLAWMLLFLRQQKGRATTETALLGNLFAALVGLPFLLGESPTPGDWGGILFLGVFQLGIPFLLMSIAIRHLKAMEAVLIQTLEPVFNPIWVFLVIGEQPSSKALLGGLIVIASVTLRSAIGARRETRRRRHPGAPLESSPAAVHAHTAAGDESR